MPEIAGKQYIGTCHNRTLPCQMECMECIWFEGYGLRPNYRSHNHGERRRTTYYYTRTTEQEGARVPETSKGVPKKAKASVWTTRTLGRR